MVILCVLKRNALLLIPIGNINGHLSISSKKKKQNNNNVDSERMRIRQWN